MPPGTGCPLNGNGEEDGLAGRDPPRAPPYVSCSSSRFIRSPLRVKNVTEARWSLVSRASIRVSSWPGEAISTPMRPDDQCCIQQEVYVASADNPCAYSSFEPEGISWLWSNLR
jgi:hypothetical protein